MSYFVFRCIFSFTHFYKEVFNFQTWRHCHHHFSADDNIFETVVKFYKQVDFFWVMCVKIFHIFIAKSSVNCMIFIISSLLEFCKILFLDLYHIVGQCPCRKYIFLTCIFCLSILRDFILILCLYVLFVFHMFLYSFKVQFSFFFSTLIIVMTIIMI